MLGKNSMKKKDGKLKQNGIKTERELTAKFSYFLRKVKKPPFLNQTYAIEFKLLKKNRLNFNSDLRPVQIPSLLQARNDCLYYKISDQSSGTKPFDAFQICYSSAYLAIGFFNEREIYFIPVEKLDLKKISISKEEIKKLSKYTIDLWQLK